MAEFGSVLSSIARAPAWVLVLVLLLVVAIASCGRMFIRYLAYRRHEKFAERIYLAACEREGTAKAGADAVKAVCPVVAKPFWTPELTDNELPSAGQVVELVSGQAQARHTRRRNAKKTPGTGAGPPAAVS